MENLKIEVEETKTYWERMSPWLFGAILWICIFSCWYYFLLPKQKESFIFLFLFFLVIIFYSGDDTCKNYVTVLEISESQVYISYKKRNQKFEVKDSLEKFEFEECSNNHGQTVALKIRYNNKIIIKQYKLWKKWKEGAFYNTLDYLKKYNLLTEKYLFGLITKKRKQN